MEHIVIIGNGIAGVTAARHIRKLSDHRITLISAETRFFFSRTALMYVYMGHMRWKDIEPYENWFWQKNRLDLVYGYVEKVIPGNNTLVLSDRRKITYDKLLIASGSKTSTFGWEGLDLPQVQGLVSKGDLEQLERHAPNRQRCPRAVIVGGGLIGVELAEMLRTRDIGVTFLVRENTFWNNILSRGESGMISRHIISHGVDLRHNTNLDKILADENGNVRAVLTTDGEEIPCNLVGITTGVTPSIDFLKDSGIETDRGVLVNRLLQTSEKDVYALGDCAQQREPIGKRPSVEAVWYTGRIMGEVVARTVCGEPTPYHPGNWFNSAKFFDIEYQTYGWVLPEARQSAEEAHFHWIHKDDDKCLTIAYQKDSLVFLGVNTFGIRLRHAVADRWLDEGRTVQYVMENLGKANFDPEFNTRYETEVREAFYKQLKSPVL
jgi:NAD(P)H-nitrite reductase large subunit